MHISEVKRNPDQYSVPLEFINGIKQTPEACHESKW